MCFLVSKNVFLLCSNANTFFFFFFKGEQMLVNVQVNLPIN